MRTVPFLIPRCCGLRRLEATISTIQRFTVSTTVIAACSGVEIESLAEDGKRRVVGGFWVKPYSIPVGSIGAYYPETNPLLPLAYHDLKSGTPAAKSIPVLVRLQVPQLASGK
jgi:hypothetical protein